MKSIIVAHDRNRVIGREGDLPWAGRMRSDMQYFTDATIGGTVIMGRRTFESLPERFRPLPDRQNIVISMGLTAANGFEIARTLDEAYELAAHENVNIIGGGQIYALALPTVDRVIATEIDATVKGGDTLFPKLPKDEWSLEEIHHFPADERNMYPYAFATYLRNNRTNQ